MSHDDIVLEKQDRVRANILFDLIYEETDAPAFNKQFGEFMLKKFKNSKANGQIEVERDVLPGILAMITNNPIYRLKLNKNASIDTDCYDLIDSFSPGLKKHYDSVDDLPHWAQEKLAVLMVINPTSTEGREVTGIGRRISELVFWVYANGNDTGKTGESSREEATG